MLFFYAIYNFLNTICCFYYCYYCSDYKLKQTAHKYSNFKYNSILTLNINWLFNSDLGNYDTKVVVLVIYFVYLIFYLYQKHVYLGSNWMTGFVV